MNLRAITDRVYDGLEQNNFRTLGLPEEVMFDRPLIGVAAGDDPYFTFLKEHIGEFHWTPAEAFALKYGEADPASLRVISMVFPQSARTKEAQKQAQVFPCDRWVVSRGEWEPMMREFSSKFVQELEAAGIPAVSIDLQPQWKREQSEHLGIPPTLRLCGGSGNLRPFRRIHFRGGQSNSADLLHCESGSSRDGPGKPRPL